MTALPPPGTATEMYLAAVLGELRAIRSQLAPPEAPASDGPVELTEPAAPQPPSAARRTTRPPGGRTRRKD